MICFISSLHRDGGVGDTVFCASDSSRHIFNFSKSDSNCGDLEIGDFVLLNWCAGRPISFVKKVLRRERIGVVTRAKKGFVVVACDCVRDCPGHRKVHEAQFNEKSPPFLVWSIMHLPSPQNLPPPQSYFWAP